MAREIDQDEFDNELTIAPEAPITQPPVAVPAMPSNALKQIVHGRPNKPLTLEATKVMLEMDYDPIRELISILRNEDPSLEDKIKIHTNLAKYRYPTQKSVESNITKSTSVTVNVVRFSDNPIPPGLIQPNKNFINKELD